MQSINEFKYSTKKETKDLFIVDIYVDNNYSVYLSKLNKWCRHFPRVFQLTHKPIVYTFNHETKEFFYEWRRPENLDLLFKPSNIKKYSDEINNIPNDYTLYKTMYGDSYIYLINGKWIYFNNELTTYLLSKPNIILVGLNNNVSIIKKCFELFNCTVEINYDNLIYD